MTNETLQSIGDSYGDRDHTSVIHALNTVYNQIELNEDTQDVVAEIRDAIREKLVENFTIEYIPPLKSLEVESDNRLPNNNLKSNATAEFMNI